jgi:hypothetical protein
MDLASTPVSVRAVVLVVLPLQASQKYTEHSSKPWLHCIRLREVDGKLTWRIQLLCNPCDELQSAKQAACSHCWLAVTAMIVC